MSVETDLDLDLDVDLTIEPVCEKQTRLGYHSDDTEPTPCNRPATWMAAAACGNRTLACEAHHERYLDQDWESRLVRCFACKNFVGPNHWTWTRL